MKTHAITFYVHFWALLAAFLLGLKLSGNSLLCWGWTLAPLWLPPVVVGLVYVAATLFLLPGAVIRYRAKKRSIR